MSTALPSLATNLAWDTSKVAVNGNLAVMASVVITNAPSGVITNAGSTVAFAVGASGSPALGYQWRLNGTNLLSATLATLTLTNVQLTNAGSYTVVVTNSASSATSAVAVLTVNVPVGITNQPAGVVVYVNSNAVFSVTAGGVPAPGYQWRYNGTNILGATAGSYTVTGARPTNEGNYTVVLANAAGSITSSPAGLSLYREYGRAPAPYPSMQVNNGARHLVVPGYQLGATNIASTDARTNGTGEDGITLVGVLAQGQGATLKVVATGAGYLNGWLDGKTNGSWADAGDQVLTNLAMVAGTNTVSFRVPGNAAATLGTWARFRFSSATNLAYTGEAPDGEVEDYPVAISALTLTYAAGTNGTISGTSPQTVNYGANGTAVTAMPDTGYHFVDWSDSSTTNPRTDMNVTNSLTVTANFAINTYTLNYAAVTNGSISGTSPQTVNYGGSGTAVTAVPASGYAFTNWSDGNLVNPRTDANVTNSISVAANFVSVVSVPPVIAGSPVLGAGGLQLTFSGPAGQSYKILTSPDITQPMINWTVLTNGTFGASPVTFTNAVSPATPVGYYRITSP